MALRTAAGPQCIERGLAVRAQGGGQHHIRGGKAIQYAAPYMGAELAHVLQGSARAVRSAHHIDLCSAQRLAHGVQVLHGQSGREKTQVRRRTDEG